MQTKTELLAPVGSWEALVAAVQNGADAVYIGGKMFSARQYANNFDEAELKRAVDYAHVRGVSVYIAVNTLVLDDEFPVLIDYLKFLYEAGVDAVIVQDLGVARVLNKALPELEVHASTQMTIHNSAGAEVVKDIGMKRVVLARELSLKEIAAIRSDVGIEVEVFVHGALCISYSGQCLMSSMIGGRSGNRGRCAQPCRLNYVLVDREGRQVMDPDQVGKYLLSPRDLRLLLHIPDLTEAGVDALKIEGRMKRPEYVATVTRIYREALDRFFRAPYDFEVDPREEKELYQIFNRDFSTGYFLGNTGPAMMSYKRPNNRGIKIGRVVSYDRARGLLSIQLEEELNLGDGIEIWVSEGGRKAAVIHQMFIGDQPVERGGPGDTVSLQLRAKVRSGDRVFKTHDAELMRKAQLTFTSPKELRKISISMKVRGQLGEPLQIIVEDPDGNKAVAKTTFKVETAIKHSLTKETVRRQVERLGNTPFYLAALDIRLDPNIMVPLSEINDARRQALNLLEQQRIMLKKPAPLPELLIKARLEEAGYTSDTKAAPLQKPELSVAVGSRKAAEEALKGGADLVYIQADGLSGLPLAEADLAPLAELARQKGARVLFSTPRLTHNRDRRVIEPFLEKARRLELGVQVSNLGDLALAKEMGFSTLYADYPLNAFNTQTLMWLQEAGVQRVSLSPELTLKQIEKMTFPVPVEVLVQGSVPLMVSAHCVTGSLRGGLGLDQNCSRTCRQEGYALKDRMGLRFPIYTDIFCRSHIFNPKELCLVEDLKNLYLAGVTTLRIEARKDGAPYVAQCVKIYRQEIDRLLGNLELYVPSGEAKERLEALSGQGLTKGHLYRGVT